MTEGNEPPSEHLETETIVVTSEQGVVITGNKLDAFEARVKESNRRNLRPIYGLITVLFVLLAGLGIVLTNVSDTVKNTDDTISRVTGTEGQDQNAKAIQSLISNVNCANQKNLQRLLDKLAASGEIKVPQGDTFVDLACTTTTTSTTVKPSTKKTKSSSVRITPSTTRAVFVVTTTTTITIRPSSTTIPRPPSTTSTTVFVPTPPTTACVHLIISDVCGPPTSQKGNQNGPRIRRE